MKLALGIAAKSSANVLTGVMIFGERTNARRNTDQISRHTAMIDTVEIEEGDGS